MNPTFFASAAEFHAWLQGHHASEKALWVGFYKKHSGRGGLTYDEAVEEALCFGWIDGIIKRIDGDSYMHRFTPRQPRSFWSIVNLDRFRRLSRAGRIQPAGRAAFAARDPARDAAYSYEARRKTALPPELARQFRAQRAAWSFFSRQAPSYQRAMLHYIASAKRPETRLHRLQKVIGLSAAGRRLL
ncbi:MAG: YdeI/OmpD-associated family protein [Verrucomicrobia bacterium]|nr:YdeI/OmpD-associated family protein [Verrucomicrobiota bacterium]